MKKDKANKRTFWSKALSIGVAFGGLIPVMPSASYAEGNLDEAVISHRAHLECARENLSIKEQIHEKEEEHHHSSGYSFSTKPLSDAFSLYQNVDKAIKLNDLLSLKAEVELQKQEYQKALHQDIAKDLQEKGLSKKETEAQIGRVEHVNKTLDAMKEDLELSRLKAVKAIEKEHTQKALDERLIPSEERVSKEEAIRILDEAKNKPLGGLLDGKSGNIYQDFVKEQQAILAHYGKELEKQTTGQKLVGAAKEYAEAAQNFVHGFYQEVRENPLGMAQAFAYEVGDFVTPGGLDAPSSFIKGEIGMAELMGRQSANIACEVAAGYTMGKVIKGMYKLGKYSAHTLAKIAHKVHPKLWSKRELNSVLNASGNEAIALVEKLTQKCEVLERPLESKYYSTIFQARLKEGVHFPDISRRKHFQECNKQLHNYLNENIHLKEKFSTEYPGLIDFLKPSKNGVFSDCSPSGLTWHHNAHTPGLMELVPMAQHRSRGPIQKNLHPDRKGGMENWGITKGEKNG